MVGPHRRLGLQRSGLPLLKTVNGKPHAQQEDHEEVQQVPAPQHFDDINAEPADSDDELRVPKQSEPKPSLKSSDTGDTPLNQPPGLNRKRKTETTPRRAGEESKLRRPNTNKKNRCTPIVPRQGQFEQSRATKEIRQDKENVTSQATPPASSAPQDDFEFGLSSQRSQRGPAKKYGTGKTKNIHATAGSGSKPKSTSKQQRKGQTQSEDEHSDTDVSMLSAPVADEPKPQLKHGAKKPQPQSKPQRKPEPAPADPELRSVPSRQTRKPRPTNSNAYDSIPLTEAELDSLLKPTLREQLGLDDTQPSSPPPSSAPQSDLDNVSSYVRELPTEAEEGTICPLCHSPVDQDTYWQFWKNRPKTVKHQATFCHTHRVHTARLDYASEGFPSIDWTQLPSRIKAHRMDLYAILTNDTPTPSPFRIRYAPLALTGKAAAAHVASLRRDLSPTKRAELASHALDDADAQVYPGYYGARGRRAISESVMALLHAEIKNTPDPVVQTSGPAAFVQAVMVPEVAIRLIAEDMCCDLDAAEEIRERTFEMGVLLNEEVEDEVLVGDGEEGEGENEYLV
ncbi:hypothetical protein E8E13_005550 [Curvularia kusanoi]|uniref:Restriction of telomere capping protein 4 n=1 Tax=Curvularia kusanoi TaxID=90978 RepID=A0A9P4W6C1_CURKU|nr:hypothetical protein E8E13_005550 [Curvularia kusanoi]